MRIIFRFIKEIIYRDVPNFALILKNREINPQPPLAVLEKVPDGPIAKALKPQLSKIFCTKISITY